VHSLSRTGVEIYNSKRIRVKSSMDLKPLSAVTSGTSRLFAVAAIIASGSLILCFLRIEIAEFLILGLISTIIQSASKFSGE
jgi:hypothetical protein